MNARIISIGDELAAGTSVDTNAAWLARRLASVGLSCARHVVVPDDRAAIVHEIIESARHAGLVLITGGLGPTPDDLTREALADAMGVELAFRPESLSRIEAYFAARNRPMHPNNRRQAMCPVGAEPLENACGTAPGIHAKLAGAEVFVMPGVPNEMKEMFERGVLPRLPHGGAAIIQRTLQSFGVSEAEIGERLADLMQRGRTPAVGTSAADLVISIHIRARAKTPQEAARLVDADAEIVMSRLGAAVFGEGDETLQLAVGRLLIARQMTISTAESCTGGLIAKRLTDLPGASAYMLQAWVTYSNEAKRKLLDIPLELIASHGAVSAPVAEAMAASCRCLSGADFALSATGIAGPTGATAQKPVGLVYVALADADRVVARELRFGDTLTRAEVRDRAAKAALNLLRLRLMA